MLVTEYTPGTNAGKLGGAAVCLGFFDGVHIGHRALIFECVKYAHENSLVPTVFTFPSECTLLKGGAPRIYKTKDKLALIASLGIEHTVLADFDSVAGLSPREFVEEVLIRDINARAAHSGHSFRFGMGAVGDTAALASLMAEHVLPTFTVDDVSHLSLPVSSTRIREALRGADMQLAKELLGAPYFSTGSVVHGDGRGHLFGFPTVNTELYDDGLLPSGVYRTELDIDGVGYSALTNVGTCPTFGERERHAETLILDFSGDLYGRRVTVRFLEYLRQEMRFSNGEELAETIKKDIEGLK